MFIHNFKQIQDEDQIDQQSRRTSKRLKEQKGKDNTQTLSFDDKFTNVEEEHVENNDKGANGHGEHMKPHHMHLYQTSSQRGRGRPSKLVYISQNVIF